MSSEIILGGGCFWCTEAIFRMVKGVDEVIPGYSGGDFPNPSYEDVCTDKTGHAEVVKLKFNENAISLDQILDIFFEIHDPTTLNRQGADVGTQYRSIIIAMSPAQMESVENYMKELRESGRFRQPVVTQVEMFKNFYPAESYHMKYFERNQNNPYCRIVISPKVKKFLKHNMALVKG